MCGDLLCLPCTTVLGAKVTLECKRDALIKHAGPLHDKRLEQYGKMTEEEKRETILKQYTGLLQAHFEGVHETEVSTACYGVLVVAGFSCYE